ncbi:MAG: succinate dehydrogenase assembly factor 2 [Gammaproteobacteria bacterium]|nr:succinate dehydrogenase assembly factor 2 [Gammaproteobacteria bacterium]
MSQLAHISASQLYWRCRRGMLELDLLLNTFVEAEYNSLTKEDTILFSTMLDYQDQFLLDLLLGKTQSPDATISNLAARIKNACHEKFKLQN